MCPPIVEDAEHEQHGERGEGCEHQQALDEPAPDRRMRRSAFGAYSSVTVSAPRPTASKTAAIW
jgi:hypothetical protein